MPAAPCSRRSPLVRSGLTQDARRRPELAPGHFLPDERDLADLILFGQRFAAHVRFYPAPGAGAAPDPEAQRNWSAFFGDDVTARLAALAKLPVGAFRAFHADLDGWLKAEPARGEAQLAAHAKLVFHLPVALAGELARLHEGLPQGHPLRAEMAELARRELAAPLAALAGWYKGGVESGVFADTPLAADDYDADGSAGDGRLRFSSTIANVLIRRPALSALGEEWFASALLESMPGGWPALYAAAAADSAPYLEAPNRRYEQVYDMVEYNLLASAVERVYAGAARVARDAAARLEESLTDFAAHLPHYGLWLAFLRLFRHARAELNTFTERHLDFYYRDVLRLSARAPEPDKVHLLFELAKGRDAHLLAAGTMVRAGADATGVPVAYALENDLVVNRAHVAELRSLRIKDEAVRAAAVAASRDGLGEVPLAADDPAWSAFGPVAAPAARIGFAVADRRLFLREGERTISLSIALRHPLPAGLPPSWTVRLTGAEGWYLPQRAAVTRIDAAAAEQTMEIVVALAPGEPAIVPLDAKLHGTEHPPGRPCMEIMFDFAGTGSSAGFARLQDAEITQASLLVSASGLRNLTVAGGGAVADPAMPFAPFGAQPRAGAALIVGSSEIFSKRIDALTLTLDWERAYSSSGFFRNDPPDAYNPEAALLVAGRWTRGGGGKSAAPVDIGLGEIGVEARIGNAWLIDGGAAQAIDNPPLSAASNTGFLKLTLPKDFGHAQFPSENTRALIALASADIDYTPASGVNVGHSPPPLLRAGRGGGGGITKARAAETALQGALSSDARDARRVMGTGGADASDGLPLAPYDPVLTRIEAAYTSEAGSVAALRHLHPFGASPASGRRLLPDLPFEGALLIGIADFAPPARLTLLVQVADGSGDPLRAPPALAFHYLDGDNWRAFEDRDVDDKTANFANSGILGLNVPEGADAAHGQLPSGLHWIRISAAENSNALNRLLSIDAQGARATFVDCGNDPDFLSAPLPAGTISKLLAPDVAVKKVRQPYASFGGRPAEAGGAFATRVSERLRHKDRAVTAADVEALVLEAFPKLHRVKCLPTTELPRGPGDRILADNEAMPGALTVVAVPQTHGDNARNPLRPYADQATLTAVRDFLRPRLSPFVRLEVQNPKFEEIEVAFRVRFRSGIGDTAFYVDALSEAIVAFLSPWERPGGGEIMFGGRLWKSAVVDFVEERPEVDYVTDFRLFHKPDADEPAVVWTPVDVDRIEATTARSILVSARSHRIEEAPADG
jgi:hypothetical protein